ncbi:MAG: DUF1579 domain-containing protein [Planctomycetota bacterium]|nr:MAG: DUF1579 domain-containing protein [Planctomycetota bacterium]
MLGACRSTHNSSAPSDSQVPAGFQAAASAEHKWLRQLVGEWNVVGEGSMGEGQPSMKLESTESVRSIGDLWVQGESRATMDGQPFTAVMTLGYDTRAGKFVGSWVDSMQTHQWVYRGTLDAEQRVLTLETEGPSFTDAAKNTLFRDAIELVDANHKVLRSSVRNPDGTWTPIMTATYTRRR